MKEKQLTNGIKYSVEKELVRAICILHFTFHTSMVQQISVEIKSPRILSTLCAESQLGYCL